MPTVRTSPRISINQLAMYLVSSAGQRRAIVRKAKFPPTFQVNWYDLASVSICEFIQGGLANEAILLTELTRLDGLIPTSDYEETRFRTNGEALEAFLDSYENLNFEGLTVTQGNNSPPRLNLSGVEISVRPEFHLAGTHRQQPFVGGLKLYYSKDTPLTDVTAPYISAIVKRFVDDHVGSTTVPARAQHCLVLDVFAGKVHSAPTAITRRFQDIEAACDEIAAIWPRV